MTTQERKVMELALEALKDARALLNGHHGTTKWFAEEITAIKEALAQPEQVSPMSEPNRAIAYAASGKLHELGYRYLNGEWVQPKEPEQEPVAYKCWHPNGYGFYYGGEPANQFRADTGEPNEYFGGKTEPLYTTPPQTKEPEQELVAMADYMAIVEKYAFLKASQRKPMTDEQIKVIYEYCDAPTGEQFIFEFARSIEAAHNIKE